MFKERRNSLIVVQYLFSFGNLSCGNKPWGQDYNGEWRGVIFNPKIYFAGFGPSEKEGGGQIFPKIIRFGTMTYP